MTKNMAFRVRLDDVDALTASHLLPAADRHRKLGLLSGEFLELALQRDPVRAAGRVLPDRFVHRHGDPGYGVHHNCSHFVGFVAFTRLWSHGLPAPVDHAQPRPL